MDEYNIGMNYPIKVHLAMKKYFVLGFNFVFFLGIDQSLNQFH